VSNPILEYLDDPKLGIAGKPWTAAALPWQVPEVPGFRFGQPLDGQASAVAFTKQSLGAIWAVLPENAKSELTGAISDALSAVGNVAGALSPFAAMAGPLIAYAQLIMEVPGFIEGFIGGTIKTNDQRRYKSRLAAVELLEAAGPVHWTFENYLIPKYKRDRGGLKDDVTNMAWPPDLNSMLTEAAIPRSGNCSEGGSNLSPTSSSCKGSITLTPLFMPVWSQRALGHPGPFVSMRQGMERSTDGGALIWQKMLQMQAALLLDPIRNLYANGQSLWAFAQRFSGIASEALENSGWTVDPAFINDAPPIFADDSTPDDPKMKPRFYRTPGGLYGVYVGGEGTTESEVLFKSVGYTKEKREHPTYSSFGGNGVSFANYNSVMSAVGQFFALRRATLQSQATCKALVDAGEEYVQAIPEPKLRKAVQAAAAGVKIPTGPGAGGFGLAAGPTQAGPTPPAGPWSLADVAPPKAGGGDAGAVAALGGAFLLWRALR